MMQRRTFLASMIASGTGMLSLPDTLDAQVNSGSLRRADRFPVYGQPDAISCGPACASMVLGYYGISAGIGPLKTSAGTRWIQAGRHRIGMTLPNGLRNAMNRYGLSTAVWRGQLSTLIDVIRQDRPPIVLVRSGDLAWHYVVVIAFNNGTQNFQIADPGGGGHKRWIPGAWLDLGWSYSGNYYDGQRLPASSCLVCGGNGRMQAKTKCVPCSGTGSWSASILGIRTTCVPCGGSGWLGTGWTNCVACNATGRATDIARPLVENIASSRVVIIPNSAPTGSTPTTSPQSTTHRIWIENPLPITIHYGVNGQRFSIGQNQTQVHSSNAEFNFEFDWSFEEGYQRRAYRLLPGSRNYFVQIQGGLDLHRR